MKRVTIPDIDILQCFSWSVFLRLMKRSWTFVIIAAVLLVGCTREPDSPYAREIPVLTYHHLLKQNENPFPDNGAILSVELFETQMRILYERGYHPITLRELEQFVAGELRLPSKSVLITLDDGYKSTMVYAYPILKRYDFKATVFLITGFITEETAEFNPNTLQYASWEESEGCRDVFEYACHSHMLHFLVGEDSYLTVKPSEEVAEDLRVNREIIGSPYFAYPYGQHKEEIISILKELGYTMAFTTEEGNVKSGDDVFRLKRRGVFPYTRADKFEKIIRTGW